MKWLSHRQRIVSHHWLDQLARLVQLVWLDSFDYQPELFNSFRLIHLINSRNRSSCLTWFTWKTCLNNISLINLPWCMKRWCFKLTSVDLLHFSDFFDSFSPLTSSLLSLFWLLWFFHFFAFFWLLNLPNFLKWLYIMLYFAYWRSSKRATVV